MGQRGKEEGKRKSGKHKKWEMELKQVARGKVDHKIV